MTPRPETLKKAKEYEKVYDPYLSENGVGLIPDAPKEAVEAFEKEAELFDL